MTKYDSKVIYQFADQLYREAGRVVGTCSFYGAILGLALGGGAWLLSAGHVSAIVALVLTCVCGYIGYVIGVRRAFALRLRAQEALCHVQIEENTRSRTESAAPVARSA